MTAKWPIDLHIQNSSSVCPCDHFDNPVRLTAQSNTELHRNQFRAPWHASETKILRVSPRFGPYCTDLQDNCIFTYMGCIEQEKPHIRTETHHHDELHYPQGWSVFGCCFWSMPNTFSSVPRFGQHSTYWHENFTNCASSLYGSRKPTYQHAQLFITTSYIVSRWEAFFLENYGAQIRKNAGRSYNSVHTLHIRIKRL